MNGPTRLHLVVEDDLSEAIARRLVSQLDRPFQIGICYGKSGFGYLRKNAAAFSKAAKGVPCLMLTDLDQAPCAPGLIARWFPSGHDPNLIFRVAVREIEAWVMADRTSFARFLDISADLIPSPVDAIPDPKKYLIGLARKSPKRDIRESLAPPRNSQRVQGPDYNGPLCTFVRDHWNLMRARVCSPSLNRAANALAAFSPLSRRG